MELQARKVQAIPIESLFRILVYLCSAYKIIGLQNEAHDTEYTCWHHPFNSIVFELIPFQHKCGADNVGQNVSIVTSIFRGDEGDDFVIPI